jgi:hypothetical protein
MDETELVKHLGVGIVDLLASDFLMRALTMETRSRYMYASGALHLVIYVKKGFKSTHTVE